MQQLSQVSGTEDHSKESWYLGKPTNIQATKYSLHPSTPEPFKDVYWGLSEHLYLSASC